MAQDLPDQTEPLTIILGKSEKGQLEALAYEASAPGSNVSTSQVAREAIRAYLDDTPDPNPPEQHDGFQTAAERREAEAGE